MPSGESDPQGIGIRSARNKLSETFQAARDFLLHHRDDYEAACTGFRWPRLDRFNWALDWFDALARSERGGQIALWVVSEDGTETRFTFRQLSERSSRIANHLRALGVRRGHPLL